jgi:hypothetical protein
VDAFEEPYKRPGMHLHFVVFFFDKKIFSEWKKIFNRLFNKNKI